MKVLKLSSIILIMLISFSMYYFKETSYSVVINAPIEEVWNYASDSSKAAEWSVYFHHISPLPGIQDGKVGSLRRCYRRADETGMMWDEEVLEIVPLKYRQLRTYNIKGINDVELNEAEFRVHQRYEKIDENTSKLTFASELIKPWKISTVLKLVLASFEGERIFQTNLENIKHAIEQKDNYQRIHAYETSNKYDL